MPDTARIPSFIDDSLKDDFFSPTETDQLLSYPLAEAFRPDSVQSVRNLYGKLLAGKIGCKPGTTGRIKRGLLSAYEQYSQLDSIQVAPAKGRIVVETGRDQSFTDQIRGLVPPGGKLIVKGMLFGGATVIAGCMLLSVAPTVPIIAGGVAAGAAFGAATTLFNIMVHGSVS